QDETHVAHRSVPHAGAAWPYDVAATGGDGVATALRDDPIAVAGRDQAAAVVADQASAVMADQTVAAAWLDGRGRWSVGMRRRRRDTRRRRRLVRWSGPLGVVRELRAVVVVPRRAAPLHGVHMAIAAGG